MRRPQGVFNNGGVREPISAENRGREPRQRQGTLELDLARRPRWGGGALRAFRRAEIIFGAVLFKSCVGEAAGTMAVASTYSSAPRIPPGRDHFLGSAV